VEDYQSEFTLPLYMTYLPLGDSTFEWGHPRSSGLWTGIINNSDGYLTGRDLFFSYEDSGLRFGQVGSGYILASASTFSVAGGIPEPGTWAMMLLGFVAVGTSQLA
jgi:hypothetical protein